MAPNIGNSELLSPSSPPMHKRASPRSQSPAPSRAHVPSPASSTVRVPTLPQESVKSGSETGTDPIPSTLQEPRQPMIPTIASRTDESASVSDPAVLDRAPPPPQKPAHEPDPKTPADPTPPPPHEPEAPTPETSDKSVPDAASLISPDNNIPLGSTTAIVKGEIQAIPIAGPATAPNPISTTTLQEPSSSSSSSNPTTAPEATETTPQQPQQKRPHAGSFAAGAMSPIREEDPNGSRSVDWAPSVGMIERRRKGSPSSRSTTTAATTASKRERVRAKLRSLWGRWGKGRRKAAGEKRASARQRGLSSSSSSRRRHRSGKDKVAAGGGAASAAGPEEAGSVPAVQVTPPSRSATVSAAPPPPPPDEPSSFPPSTRCYGEPSVSPLARWHHDGTATATPPPKQPENGRASKPKRSAERPRKTVRSSPAGSHSSLGRPSPVSSMLMMATAMPTFSA